MSSSSLTAHRNGLRGFAIQLLLVAMSLGAGAVAVTALVPEDVVVTDDPGLNKPATKELLRDAGMVAEKVTPSGVAVIHTSLLGYLYRRFFDQRGESLQFVKGPVPVVFEPVAGSASSSSNGSPNLRLNDETARLITEVTPADRRNFAAHLHTIEVRLPSREPIIAARLGSADAQVGPKTWEMSAASLGGSGVAWISAYGKSSGEFALTIRLGAKTIQILGSMTSGQMTYSMGENHTSTESSVATTSIDVCSEDRRICAKSDPACRNREEPVEENWPVVTVKTIATRHALDFSLPLNNLNVALQEGNVFLNSALKFSGIAAKVKYEQLFVDEDVPDDVAECKMVSGLLDAAREAQLSVMHAPSRKMLSENYPAYKRIAEQKGKSDLAVILVSPIWLTSNECPRITSLLGKGHAGYTPKIPASGTVFFSIVVADKMLFNDRVLEHEIGHLLGARHSPEDQGETVPPTNHGYSFLLPNDAENIYGDIMTRRLASDARSNLVRMQRFSNPGEQYRCNGEILGRNGAADNATAIATAVRNILVHRETPWPDGAAFTESAACLSAGTPLAVSSTPHDQVMDVRFALGASDVDACAAIRLSKFAGCIASPSIWEDGQPAQIIVSGNTDSTGTQEGNSLLAFNRAIAVRNTLPKSLTEVIPTYACSYASYRPLVQEVGADREAARAANRRVDITVIPENKEFERCLRDPPVIACESPAATFRSPEKDTRSRSRKIALHQP